VSAGYPDLSLLIAGRWRRGENRDLRPVVNPATGSVVAQLPLATTADLDEACEAAASAFPRWRETPARGAQDHVMLTAPETPFGGVKDSGYGSEGGSEGIDDYLFAKLVSEA
jgi:acyl-CoA reductase-like NAD-dependent aldehyde dehydrogenase